VKARANIDDDQTAPQDVQILTDVQE